MSMPAEQSSSLSISPAAVALHVGIVIAGIVTTLLGPVLPVLISRWSLSDERAGLFFTAQFCGSILGVASMTAIVKKGYRYTFVSGFSLMAVGVAGLNLQSNAASLVATAVFGCGLGQVLSASNLWVAEVAKTRRVAALSILNFMWGLGAIGSAPLVMLAQRNGSTQALLYTVAACSALVAITLLGMNMEPAKTEAEAVPIASLAAIKKRSTISLAVLFFLYVGSENSVAGWAASLAKRMNSVSGDLWAVSPMFFWGGLLAGRALVPLLPAKISERALLVGGLIFSSGAVCFLLQAKTFPAIVACVTAAGLGFAGTYPILIAWLVRSFGERSRRIGGIMFALAAMGGATMPWFVGFVSTGTNSLRMGLLVPLAGCVAMLACIVSIIEPTFSAELSTAMRR
jgi:MFS transporter, FHS family, glucose/mannose:H+ symporter